MIPVALPLSSLQHPKATAAPALLIRTAPERKRALLAKRVRYRSAILRRVKELFINRIKWRACRRSLPLGTALRLLLNICLNLFLTNSDAFLL